jgi:hypothetical protein
VLENGLDSKWFVDFSNVVMLRLTICCSILMSEGEGQKDDFEKRCTCLFDCEHIQKDAIL